MQPAFTGVPYAISSSTARSSRERGPKPKGRGRAIREQQVQELQEYAREDAINNVYPPRVLILVGIQGSGKSTFSKLFTKSGWARVSQDDLGTRIKCEQFTVEYLKQGRSVVVDRCNFDRTQRHHWIGKFCILCSIAVENLIVKSQVN